MPSTRWSSGFLSKISALVALIGLLRLSLAAAMRFWYWSGISWRGMPKSRKNVYRLPFAPHEWQKYNPLRVLIAKLGLFSSLPSAFLWNGHLPMMLSGPDLPKPLMWARMTCSISYEMSMVYLDGV